MLSNYNLYTFLTSSFFVDCYVLYDQKVKQTVLDFISYTTHNSFRHTLTDQTFDINADANRYEFL